MNSAVINIFLFEPYIGEMYGPFFLLFYAIVIIAAFLFIRYGYKLFESDAPYRHLIPGKPDHYEIAYLRGGTREVIKLGLYSLLSRGYLKSSISRNIRNIAVTQAEKPPRVSFLDPLEKEVFDKVGNGMVVPRHLTKNDDLEFAVYHCCYDYESKLCREKLLYEDSMEHRWKIIRFITVVIVAGIGVYKLAAALENGKNNIVLLVGMMIIGTALLLMQRPRARIAPAGRKCLDQLMAAFQSRGGTLRDSHDLQHRLLVGGIFGLSALEGTSHGYLHRHFSASNNSGDSDSSGDCSSCSSCSSSCSSCGGCGGD